MILAEKKEKKSDPPAKTSHHFSLLEKQTFHCPTCQSGLLCCYLGDLELIRESCHYKLEV